MAYLIGVRWQDGRNSHLLCFVDAMPGSERSLASAAGEALIFSGLDAGEVDVSFFRASDTITERLAKVGLRFDIPAAPEPTVRQAPGMNPSKPPKLR